MSEKIPFSANEKQEQLKQRLLSKSISVDEFLNGIHELDQSTPNRDQAEPNIKLLADPEIKNIFEQDEDAKSEYYYLLSFSHFHVGQQRVDKNPDQALPHFETALEAAEKSDDDDWRRYIQATIAYIKKDIPSMEIAYSGMEDGRRNKVVVGNMLQGLKEFGSVDYKRDYNRE